MPVTEPEPAHLGMSSPAMRREGIAATDYFSIGLARSNTREDEDEDKVVDGLKSVGTESDRDVDLEKIQSRRQISFPT